jgi:hypothetical protein
MNIREPLILLKKDSRAIRQGQLLEIGTPGFGDA